MLKKLIIPLFIPHLGCPHMCVFCNQKKIAGEYEKPTAETVKKIVDKYLLLLKKRNKYNIELAFYGGSFTAIPDCLQEELLNAAHMLKKAGKLDGIRMSTRPDYINPPIIKRLLKYGVETVELGVQSLEQEVLDLSERGHKEEDVYNAVTILKESGIKVGIQLMPGLPGDSLERTIRTTQKVIAVKPDLVRIYPTIVIKNTKLADWYAIGKYVPWDLEKTIEASTDMYILFSKSRIPVIRMGLQATDNLNPDKDLVAGPFQPAFGELVKARVFRRQTDMLLNLHPETINKGNKEIKIHCNSGEISQVIGQKSKNINFFQEKYNIIVKVRGKDSIQSGTIILEEKKISFFLSRRAFLAKYRIK